MGKLLSFLAGFSLTDALDIAIVSVLLYLAWSWFKRTKAAFVAIGMLILTGVYIIARILNLVLTAYIFQGFFAVFLLAIIIIFQEELRHFFERLAVLSLRRRLAPASIETEELVQTLGELAQERSGAIIVLRGRDPIERHITEGYDLGGKISRALLKSIFDPHSEGHDGAVVVGNKLVERFGVYLPLGKDLAQNARLGTRHAAALGISELTDALCLVVSEERGTISIAQGGDLREIKDLGTLRAEIDAFLHEKLPQACEKPVWARNLREKAAAVLLSFGLWFHFVHSSKAVLRDYDVPVSLHNVPASLRLEAVEPPAVRATLAGPQRDLYLLDSSRLRAHLDVSRAEPGELDIILSRDFFSLPESLVLVRVDPPTVKVRLARK
ncbi:MAG: diadenylate cyclase [Elusimicrobia bacterium]|nr:diadenylate cyclase [Elusimicrobiota bacterium]